MANKNQHVNALLDRGYFFSDLFYAKYFWDSFMIQLSKTYMGDDIEMTEKQKELHINHTLIKLREQYWGFQGESTNDFVTPQMISVAIDVANNFFYKKDKSIAVSYFHDMTEGLVDLVDMKTSTLKFYQKLLDGVVGGSVRRYQQKTRQFIGGK